MTIYISKKIGIESADSTPLDISKSIFFDVSKHQQYGDYESTLNTKIRPEEYGSVGYKA